MRKVPLAPDVDARVIARGTPGFSGADLANLVNEAALLAARNGRRVVTMAEFEAAKDKVMMGTERKSMVMTEDEKKLTAFHEAGHALVGLNVPKHDPLHKVTIIPRGRALGLTMSLPERDKYSVSKVEYESRIASMFGGRVAEELIFGKENVTSGASSDIRQATRLARYMVTQVGMSDKLGPLLYDDNEEEVFLGHSVTQRKNISDATAKLIDDEVRRLIDEGEGTARRILTEHIDDLHTVADALLEYETLSGEEVKALLRGEAIRVGGGEAPPPRPRSSVPTSGTPAREDKGRPPGGLEPEPQPGA
jgi:cell division protease FtsH